MNWEQIDSHHQRAEVFGGWLVKAYEDVNQYSTEQGFTSGYEWRVAMTFVPDQNHEWEVAK
jgi:hypothetical protein